MTVYYTEASEVKLQQFYEEIASAVHNYVCIGL